MSDAKKTILNLERFGDMAAKTVVMTCPPRMSMHLEAVEPNCGDQPVVVREPFDPRATRMAAHARGPLAENWQEIATGEIMRGPQTRMVPSAPRASNVHLPPLPQPRMPPTPCPTSFPPIPEACASTGAGRARGSSLKTSRRNLILLGAALLVGLVLLLPLSSPSARSQEATSGEQAAAMPGAQEAERNDNAQVEIEVDGPLAAAAVRDSDQEHAADTRNTQRDATEEQAAAMLLSGRRKKALAIYEELSAAPGAHPGIEAMVIVLSQKVNP